MTTIKELFEAVGEPIMAKDIRKGDLVARFRHYSREYVASITTSDAMWSTDGWSYRLLHRPAPVLPTTPGSMLAGPSGDPSYVLTPNLGWYESNAGRYIPTDIVQTRLDRGTATILLDTGATK